jgi:hypothetical protein
MVPGYGGSMFSEKLTCSQSTTRRINPEDRLHTYHRQNLKSFSDDYYKTYIHMHDMLSVMPKTVIYMLSAL